jgi:hypothetical protein
LTLSLDRGRFDQVAIVAVQRDGRWFLSPTRSALSLIDEIARTATAEDVYASLGLYRELPADGALVLGQPIDLDASRVRPTVLTFEATAGQEIVGTIVRQLDDEQYGNIYVEAYGPDGVVQDDACCIFDGQPVVLHSTGTYRFVVHTYGDGQPTTITLWDRNAAPDEAMRNADACATLPGQAPCVSAEATPVAPTTAP